MWPSTSTIRRSAPLNVVVDGNSLVYGVGASVGAGTATGTTMPAQVKALLAPFFPSLTVVNLGISGQTWRNVNGFVDLYQSAASVADVEAAWVIGANNLYIVWETTNSISETIGPGGTNRTVAQTIGDAQACITARLGTHPWLVLVLGTLPRQTSQTSMDAPTLNAQLLAADAGIQAGLRSWGGRTFINLRGPGSPFALPDYTPASFALNDSLWNEAAGSRVHLTDAGYAIVAGLVARAVLNLAAR